MFTLDLFWLFEEYDTFVILLVDKNVQQVVFEVETGDGIIILFFRGATLEAGMMAFLKFVKGDLVPIVYKTALCIDRPPVIWQIISFCCTYYSLGAFIYVFF